MKILSVPYEQRNEGNAFMRIHVPSNCDALKRICWYFCGKVAADSSKVAQDISANTGHVCQSNLSGNKDGNAQGMVEPVQDHKGIPREIVFSKPLVVHGKL